MTTDSNPLNHIICHEITQQGGLIPFDRFMELALYHPQYGYYNSATFELGKHGDFTTASEISPLFAHCFANPVRQALSLMPNSQVIEYGAGSGRFAGDLLLALAKSGIHPRYHICEISPSLRLKQQTLLQHDYPSVFQQITWSEHSPQATQGIIIANEVLDALPVNRFRIMQNAIVECCVGWDHDRFAWQYSSPITPGLTEKAEAIRKSFPLTERYESEINLRLSSFIHAVASSLQQGVILFSDYGYGQQEYYHPERIRGTLTCFQQHRHHDNPFITPGQQDITAHVNFTAVIEAGVDEGCTLLGYTSQAAFLLDNGLLTLSQQQELGLSEIEAFHLHQAIKRLTMPTEMGERVKIMALGKNIALQLRGFNGADRRREL